jgi:callose synthase
MFFAVISFLVQSYYNGDLKKWRNGGYQPIAPSPSSEFKFKGSEQKTFSYPDTLEFNYFDPDNLPRHLQAHADIIFSTVQVLASELGFQVDNSRNQSEHLLMMLANECKMGEHILTEPPNRIHGKLFANYKKWCDRVGSAPNFIKKKEAGKAYVSQIQDILIYMLIWGEAANLRHTPECICLLFHKTMQSYQLGGRKEHLYPGYFLDHVITPIYEVMATALQKKTDHEGRKTYDDFNEFFWSPSCLRYEIIHSKLDSNEFSYASASAEETHPFLAQGLSQASKTYVEKRSYFHSFLSFHRILEWHTVTFTIMACLGFSNDLIWSTAYTLQTMSVIFIEINAFGILWMCLEIWSHYPSSTISNPSICGYILRLSASYLLLTYQCIYFYWSFSDGTDNNNSNINDDFRNSGDANFWW